MDRTKSLFYIFDNLLHSKYGRIDQLLLLLNCDFKSLVAIFIQNIYFVIQYIIMLWSINELVVLKMTEFCFYYLKINPPSRTEPVFVCV